MKTTLLILKVMGLVAVMSLSSCATSTSTDAELARAERAVDGAELGLEVAQLVLAGYLTKPETPRWQLELQALVVRRASEAVVRERAKLREIQAERERERRERALVPRVPTGKEVRELGPLADMGDVDWEKWLCVGARGVRGGTWVFNRSHSSPRLRRPGKAEGLRG